MFHRIIFYTFLLATYPLATYAGQGTIRETDNAIIIEYSGEDDPDVKAVIIARERNEKQAEVDAKRQKALIEASIEKAKAKAAIRAQKGPRVRESEEEQ